MTIVKANFMVGVAMLFMVAVANVGFCEVESATAEVTQPVERSEAIEKDQNAQRMPRRGRQGMQGLPGFGPGRGPGFGPGPGGDPGASAGMRRMGWRWFQDEDALPIEDYREHRRMMREHANDWFTSPERMAELKQTNPELVELNEKTQRVRYQMMRLKSQFEAKTPEDEKEAAKQKRLLAGGLKPLVEKEIDLEVQRQLMQIEMMEKRITKLKSLVKRRQQLRDKEVSKRLKEILEAKPFRRGEPGMGAEMRMHGGGRPQTDRE